RIKVMKCMCLAFALLGMICSGVAAEAQSLLTLEAKIPLGEVRGRIDHMAVDLTRRRVYVAELENDSVGIVDFTAGQLLRTITDLKERQGLAYLPSTDPLFVANGRDGSLRFFRGDDYRAIGQIQLAEDADSIRVDLESKQVFVSHGNGAIAIVDATTRQ